jgi:hypothetical protein
MQALLNKELGNYVCELRRVGKGHGTFHFDRRWGGGWGGWGAAPPQGGGGAAGGQKLGGLGGGGGSSALGQKTELGSHTTPQPWSPSPAGPSAVQELRPLHPLSTGVCIKGTE